MKPDTLHERILDVTWDHAVHLGIPGHETGKDWTLSTDPEALTILAGIFEEARLRREWAGWLRKFGDKFHTNRLKKMLKGLLEYRDDVVVTEVPDSPDNNLLDEPIDTETVESELGPLKTLLLTVQEQTDHSFGPALKMLETVKPKSEIGKTDRAKIDNINKDKIVPHVPVLFWRHIVGVNARSELLWAVGTGWNGNNKRASSELFLPLTSVQRARKSLKPTDYVTVDQIDNSKVISKGPRYHHPDDEQQNIHFMNWFRWIRAVIKARPLIDATIDRDLNDSLEKRFTDIVQSIFKRELFAPAFTHRHGKQASQYLFDRIFEEE